MVMLRHRSVTLIDLGAETIKIAVENTKALVANAKDDVQVTLAASAGDGDVTLWSSVTGQVDEPAFLALLIDPDDTLGTPPTIQVAVTIDGVTVAFEADPTAPVIFTDADGGAALNAIDGKLTNLSVRNPTTSAVPVRLLAVK